VHKIGERGGGGAIQELGSKEVISKPHQFLHRLPKNLLQLTLMKSMHTPIVFNSATAVYGRT